MKLKKIPKFKSLKEEALFWDKNDVGEYFDLSTFTLVKPKTKLQETYVTVRMDKPLRDKIKDLAKSEDRSVSSLIRMWAIKNLPSSS